MVVLLAMISNLLYAQSAFIRDQSQVLTHFRHQVWMMQEGLPDLTVTSLAQTSDGYLWVGTGEGLLRFDGVRFHPFNKENTLAFKTDHAIQVLLTDHEGSLWIGTYSSGVVRYDGKDFTRYTAQDGLTGVNVSTLYQSRDHALWIGTRDAGLFRYAHGQFVRYSTESGFSDNTILSFLEDRAGGFWVGTANGLNRFEEGRVSLWKAESGAPLQVKSLWEDHHGTVWVGTNEGLFVAREGILASYLSGATWSYGCVQALWEDEDGILWIGTENRGIIRLKERDTNLLEIDKKLSHTGIKAFFQDKEERLWLGTKDGLHRLHQGTTMRFTTEEGLSDENITSVYEDREGVLWVGTDGGGVNRLDKDGITTYTTETGLLDNHISIVWGDPQTQTLWIVTASGGLSRMKAGEITHVAQPGMLARQIASLYQSSTDDLWVATNAGLIRIQGDTFMTYTTGEGMAGQVLTVVYEDRKGNLWIGTANEGLIYQHDGFFTTYTTADGLAHNRVLSLYEDAEGTLWIGTNGGGLSRFKEGRFTTYTTHDGLLDNTIYQILEDDYNHLWFQSEAGLFSVHKTLLDRFAQREVKRIASIGISSPIEIDPITYSESRQHSGWKRHDGTLWFASPEGLMVVNPHEIQDAKKTPSPRIESILIDGLSLENWSEGTVEGMISLPPGKKEITFNYTAISFFDAEALRFRYRLEGYESSWQDGKGERSVTYTHLPPGTYTFHVMSCNGEGVCNEASDTVSFTLKPYFFQTSWFLVLCGLCLLLAGLMGYFAYHKDLKRRKRELETLVQERTSELVKAKEQIEAQADNLKELDRFKTQFFANVSHEFRTPLTMIIGPLENALDGVYGQLPGPMARQIDIMLRNARRLMRLINQLLDLSKLEAGKMQLQAQVRDIVTFLEGVVLSCSVFAEQKKITLRFETCCDHLDLYFEPDKLEKVFFNLLSNATKFTPAGGEVVLSIAGDTSASSAPEGVVVVTVKDTGMGIPKAELPYIFDRFHQVDGSKTREHEGTGIGLALVKELVTLHRGTISVESTVGEGTTFTIVFPLGRSHLQPDEVVEDTLHEEVLELGQTGFSELAFSSLAFMSESEEGETTEAVMPVTEAARILVVEDNADVREYVAAILSQKYRVLKASDGQEGLMLARTSQPDLIISDVMMPRMDGHDLCYAIKNDPSLDHIPVILLTARATHEMKLEGLEIGADDYLNKPFNARELMARTHNLVQLKKQEKALKQLNATLEKQVEEQVQQILQERIAYEKQLVAAKEQAERSLRLKTAILDNMNHELRTPLAAIQGYAQVLSKEVEDDLKEFAHQIDSNGIRLMRAIESVHLLSRLEARDFELRYERVSLGSLLNQVQQRHADQARSKGIGLRTQIPSLIEAYLDTAAIHRIIDYLVDNAIKFTDTGEVVLSARQQEDRVSLEIKDTGIGIDASFLPYLFEAFRQESSGLTRTHSGIGISMAIVKRLTEMMGGTLEVLSEKDKGSIFTLHFPLVNRVTPVVGGGVSRQENHNF